MAEDIAPSKKYQEPEDEEAAFAMPKLTPLQPI